MSPTCKFRLPAILASLLLAGGVFAAPECDEGIVDLRGAWGEASFRVKIADDPAERARGLMHVASLPRREGMLFVFPSPGPVSFWMKNTLIPLDMLFFDESGRLLNVHSNAIPGDLTSIPGKGSVLVVLEIGGGLAELYGIEPGTEMRHPSFSPETAAWPCGAG